MSIISLVLAIVVISALIYLLLKQKANNNPKQKSYKSSYSGSHDETSSGQLNYELVKTKWAEIVAMQDKGGSGLKNALIEADKLLDYVMIHKGFSGETMGDRLKSGGSRFSNLNGVWAAHKLRNQIAHEIEHDIVAEQIKNAINILKGAIQELGVAVQ